MNCSVGPLKKMIILLSILSSIVLVCGCLSLSIYTTVQNNGNISDMTVSINTTSYVYGLIQQSAQQHGYSTVKEYMLANATKEYGGNAIGANKVDYNEAWSGDQVTMTMNIRGSFKPDEKSGMRTYRDGNYLVYEYAPSGVMPTPTPTPGPGTIGYNTSGMSDAVLSGITLSYYLEMPGKIVDSNANVVKGNKAEWHFNGKTMSGQKLYAKSEIPATPGFGMIPALSGILIGCLIMAGRRKV